MTEKYPQGPDIDDEEESGINYTAIIDAVVLHWHWFLISVILCLAIAFIYTKFKAPVYQVWTDVLIKEESNNNSVDESISGLTSLGFITNSNGFDNEVIILGSRSLSRRAVANLKLYVTYAYKDFPRDEELYLNSPIIANMQPVDLDTLSRAIVMEITPTENKNYTIKTIYDEEEHERTVKSFPVALQTPSGIVDLTPNPDSTIHFQDKPLRIAILPPRAVGDSYNASLSIEPISKLTTVARITLNGTKPARSANFLNELVRVYNESANEVKNEVALKTEAFINNRIRLIDSELGTTESSLESFKKQNQLVNFESDAEVAYRGVETYQQQQTELETQLMLVKSLREYVENPANYMEVIPANLGISDAALNKSIADYNEQVVERKRLLATSPETSPVVQQVSTAIAALYPGIKHSLLTVYENLRIQKRSVDNQYNTYISRLGQAPTQERELLDIERQQTVKAALYEILLQKREENSISLASTVDKAQVVDPAESSQHPISPRKKLIMLIGLFAGIAFPAALLYLLNLMKFKIEGRNDVERLTTIPILGDIFVAEKLEKGKRAVVVRENANGMMEETFRNLRINLDFVINNEEKVIMVTSMIGGEGKTFTASNLAMSLALSKRKTLLVGLDIRKPALSKLFAIATHHHGITAFLNSTNCTDELLREQIFNSGINPNLDILPAGTVPPNPGELIASNNLDEAFTRFRRWYDIIIVDTPPLGLVSDALMIGRVADTTLIVCRCDYSIISNFAIINEYNRTQKLPKMNLVLNGVDLEKRKYGYYYGYGRYGHYGRYGRYGYYGHYGSYGNYGSYGETETKETKKKK